MSIAKRIPTYSWRGSTVHGPWTLRIPEIKVREDEAEVYILYLAKRDGITVAEARCIFETGVQDLFNRAWSYGVKQMLAYFADHYRDIHPEDRTLKGFDPEALQGAYVPGTGQKSPQYRKKVRPGDPKIRRILTEMGGTQDGRD